MHFDDILRQIGEFGPYQKRIYFLTCLPGIIHGFRMMVTVFIQFVPDHRCAIPGYDNDTYTVQSEHHQELINRTIPYTENQHGLTSCEIYSPGNYTYNRTNQPINATVTSCSRYVYDKSVFSSTAVTKLNMVCGDTILQSHAQMVFMGGFLFGVFIIGALSDRYGRKLTFFLSMFLHFAGGLSLILAPEFFSYIFLRFINGGASAGMFTVAYVIGMEMTGPTKRKWTGIINQYFFTIGSLFLTLLGYFIRNWVYLEIAGTIPLLMFVCYYWIIPESPRWLINAGRKEEAMKIIEKIARINGTKVPCTASEIDDISDNRKQWKKFLNLFTHKILFFRTIIIFFNWMVVSMTYYGLSMNITNLGSGGLFSDFSISCIVELPGVTLCLLLIDRLGRKRLHCVIMIFGGSSCICTIFSILYLNAGYQWVTVALAMLGKMGSAAGFVVVYVYSVELYPTVIRTAAFGASSACARLGSMVAPYIVDLGKSMDSGDFGRALPLMVFGCLSVVAGLLCLLLPETLNKDLPDTIEDGEKIGAYKVLRAESEINSINY